MGRGILATFFGWAHPNSSSSARTRMGLSRLLRKPVFIGVKFLSVDNGVEPSHSLRV